MDQFNVKLIDIDLSFALPVGIAFQASSGSTAGFTGANRDASPVTDAGAARPALGRMPAAGVISMAGLPAFAGDAVTEGAAAHVAAPVGSVHTPRGPGATLAR